MGRKRYFCDYCDRSLPYSVDARKKHNSGHQHRAAKQAYYNSLKRASERYQDEIKKRRCKKFHSGQICSFGDACIYSHVTQATLDGMRTEAEMELKSKTVPSQLQHENEPSIEHIKSVLEARSHLSLKYLQSDTQHNTPPRSHFENYHPLPPSLQPFKIEHLLTAQFGTWG